MKLPRLGTPPLNKVKSFFNPVFWATTDDGLILDLMRIAASRVAPGVHFADNFFTWHRNLSLLDDEAFVNAWESNAESQSDKAIVWRRYVLACAAYHCVQLDGDFVECGSYTGVGVKTVVDYLGGTAFPKNFWAYDLFEHDENMQHPRAPEHGAALFEKVKSKFSTYPQVKVVKGKIPNVFAEQSPQRISYLHIDLNEAPAEVAALEALFDRIVPAGLVVLDDYEWAGIYRNQKLAEDAWFESHGYRVMPLPTGQGLIIKR
jgi:O-methyltransferase